MPIYDINEYRKKIAEEPRKGISIDSRAFYTRFESLKKQTDRPGFGSKIATRFFFLFLLFLNTVWVIFATLVWVIFGVLNGVTILKVEKLKLMAIKATINLKRSAVCWVALFVSLFNPALGIMFSCLYFMMYDKMGIDEIIPPSLREQFKEFFPQ